MKNKTRNIEVDANKIAFLLDAISLFDDDGDYENEDGKYSLSEEQINKFVMTLKTLLEGIKSEE